MTLLGSPTSRGRQTFLLHGPASQKVVTCTPSISFLFPFCVTCIPSLTLSLSLLMICHNWNIQENNSNFSPKCKSRKLSATFMLTSGCGPLVDTISCFWSNERLSVDCCFKLDTSTSTTASLNDRFKNFKAKKLTCLQSIHVWIR